MTNGDSFGALVLLVARYRCLYVSQYGLALVELSQISFS